MRPPQPAKPADPELRELASRENDGIAVTSCLNLAIVHVPRHHKGAVSPLPPPMAREMADAPAEVGQAVPR